MDNSIDIRNENASRPPAYSLAHHITKNTKVNPVSI